MTNFLTALQALGEAANQAAAIHAPGFIAGARGFGQEAINNIQNHAPAVANAAANFGQGVASHVQVHAPIVASAAVDAYQKHAPAIANIGQDIAHNIQLHAPAVAAAGMGAAKYLEEQAPYVLEHAAAALAGLGLLAAATKTELESKYPDIFAAISKGWFVVIDSAEQARCWVAENPGKTAIIIGGIALVVAPGIVTSPVLRLIGFGERGVTAGSIAAFIHSCIGNVAAGSAFAIFQSAGAGGAGLAVVNGVVQGAGIIAVSGTVLVSFLEEKEKRLQKNRGYHL
ncbi:hypothetical protein QBC40DRAFT_268366 [Triangularia verruculosa]|uniref:Uncharacterized protein n=1 Tax=Triangularia verruculosa TaxID=2587418 RepID=A0AAN6X9Y5_9PEZI|nr:hypothetical protein QBC40DRAFT_268366 [Triangularia verruculosa]